MAQEIDYTGLGALEAVITLGGFKKAADQVGVTQSAISQRINHLEDRYGSPLVIRKSPPSLTKLGRKLLDHFHAVRDLENQLAVDLGSSTSTSARSIILGVNADSLATWFFEAITPLIQEFSIKLEVLIENEHLTHHLIEKGEVLGCISSERYSGPGCDTIKLGVMRYVGVCSKEFYENHFSKKDSKTAFSEAPAVYFDRSDWIHRQFFKSELKSGSLFPIHFIPSSEGFVEGIVRGLGYGVTPVLQVKDHLKIGNLVPIIKGRELKVPLFFHYIRRESKVQMQFRSRFCKNATALLS
jgi:LysR family transcriptional regulator (chromosome initiation inhibitor)